MAYKDPEKRRAHKAAYYQAHAAEIRAYNAAYYRDHGAEISAHKAAYYRDHGAEIRAYKAAYRQAHPEKHRADNAAFRQAHPEKRNQYRRTRRARKSGAPLNDFTAVQWREMQAAYGHRCVYCRKRCKGKLTQDHLTPLSKGGSHTVNNIVPACMSCNSRKHVGPALVPVQPLLL